MSDFTIVNSFPTTRFNSSFTLDNIFYISGTGEVIIHSSDSGSCNNSALTSMNTTTGVVINSYRIASYISRINFDRANDIYFSINLYFSAKFFRMIGVTD